MNLLQQTPNDKPFGDVLAEFQGALRIIEFMRSRNDSSNEAVKLQGLLNYRETNEPRKSLEHI